MHFHFDKVFIRSEYEFDSTLGSGVALEVIGTKATSGLTFGTLYFLFYGNEHVC
jgi:hypothetical protein